MDYMPISEVVAELSASTGLTAAQIQTVLQAQAELAYKNAERGYPVPGIGVLATTIREARKITMRFGPKQGQEITVPAKKVLKFRVGKIAKDTVFGTNPPPENILEIELLEEERPIDD